MKTYLFIILFFLTATVTLAQVNKLIGTWTVIEMTNKSDQDSSTLTEDQFKSNGLFFDCFFMENDKFKQTGNLADESNGAVTTQEGTWKISGNNLIVTLEMGGRALPGLYMGIEKSNSHPVKNMARNESHNGIS